MSASDPNLAVKGIKNAQNKTNIPITSQQMLGREDTHVKPIVGTQHRLQKDSLDAFLHMQQQASISGVDIQICSSFRSFDKQLSIWNRKWSGELPLNTLDGGQINASDLNDNEKIHAIMLWSALPGASRHHWGTDFDVYDKTQVENTGHDFQLVPAEYTDRGPCAKLNAWIQTHANEFDFYLPYADYTGGVAREPWHLSYSPIAAKIEQGFNMELLYASIEKADILGKASVLSVLPELVNRYTFNRGTKAP